MKRKTAMGRGFPHFFQNAKYSTKKDHIGRTAIQKWIENSNQQYQTTLKPISYKDADKGSIFTAEVSGTFPGSPAILNFNLVLQQGLIQSLKITG